MEPRTQYARTSDGVSIAFWTLGEGVTLVHMPSLPWSHIQMEWEMPECRRWLQRLARKTRLVRYDSRGIGLSERDVTDFSVDRLVLDLEAIVDHLGLEKVALFGFLRSGPVAIAYAARHPERVSHLILWCTHARASDYPPSPRREGLRALMEQDWELYADTVAHTWFDWSQAELGRRFAALIRESVTPETLRAAFAAFRLFDVTPLLSQVRSPTLVLQRRDISKVGVHIARRLASQIPNAALAVLEGDSGAPYVGDMESVARAIDEFLGVPLDEKRPAAALSPSARPGGLVTIVFTDIEGSTGLTQRLGDARAREIMRTHERIVRDALRAHGGSEVKTTGDGFMASFSSATKALECAIAVQRAFADYNAGVGAQGLAPLHVRIGLNAGEPIAEEEDLFGTAVNLAARIAGKAEGGEILASDVVRQLVAGKRFVFADRGEVALRGFEDPVRLYEVRWREPA